MTKIKIIIDLTRSMKIIYRKFVEILSVMTEDWNDCANSDISMREISRKAKMSDRITNVIITLHTVTVVAYCMSIILADVDVTDTTKELLLINKLEIPFDINTQSMYRIVLIIEFLLMIFCGWATGVTNCLLLTLVSKKSFIYIGSPS